MRPMAAILPILGACLFGCSPGGLSMTGTKCSGDLSAFLAQCITNRGGQPISTKVPAIQAQWTYQFRPNEDIVVIQTNCFSEVRSVLRRAYGDPDPKAESSPVAPMGSGQSGTYGPKQVGLVLNFTGDAGQTIICILGRYGSVAAPPNSQGGANGWQSVSSDTHSSSAGAATRRSP